jgi:hypothetical protein
MSNLVNIKKLVENTLFTECQIMIQIFIELLINVLKNE